MQPLNNGVLLITSRMHPPQSSLFPNSLAHGEQYNCYNLNLFGLFSLKCQKLEKCSGWVCLVGLVDQGG